MFYAYLNKSLVIRNLHHGIFPCFFFKKKILMHPVPVSGPEAGSPVRAEVLL